MKVKNKINSLQNELTLYDANINDDPIDADSYYMRANTYIELAKCNQNNAEYLKQAEKDYNKAIELNPENALYLVDRSKLYADEGRIDAAIKGIEETKQEVDGSGDITEIYIKNTIKNIERTISYKSTKQLTDTSDDAKSNDVQSIGELIDDH